MLTIIIKRNDEPTVIHLTQHAIMKELNAIADAEILLSDSWTEGLKKVRTPYVCLVEADCVLSSNYLTSNYGLMKKRSTGSPKGGGALRTAMLASCLGLKAFDQRVYNYHVELLATPNNLRLKTFQARPYREKHNMKVYPVQIGFVPGAILRYSSIKDGIDRIKWDQPNLVKLSADVSLWLWDTNRRVEMNPNTTYVSNQEYLGDPPPYHLVVPDKVKNIYHQEALV